MYHLSHLFTAIIGKQGDMSYHGLSADHLIDLRSIAVGETHAHFQADLRSTQRSMSVLFPDTSVQH